MRIHKLDGLRGIFSMMVVLYHYPLQYLPEYVHHFFLIGKSYLFVDFFFVLSGFVIALNYNSSINDSQSMRSFVFKRFIRLYPLLFYSTLLYCFLQVGVKVFLPQFAANKDSFMPTVVDTIDTLLFLNSTPVLTDRLAMNYPSWSISAEMIAYLFYGFVVLWALEKRENLILLLAIIVGMGVLIWADLNKIHSNIGFIRGIVSFNIGYFVYYFRNKKVNISNSMEWVMALMLVALLYVAQLLEKTVMHGIVESAIMPVFFGVSIFTLLHTSGVVSRLMERNVFQYFGKISYSVYLNHAIILLVVPLGVFAVLKVPATTPIEFAVSPFVVIAVVLYSHFTYKFIELQGAQILKRLFSKSQPVQTPSVK